MVLVTQKNLVKHIIKTDIQSYRRGQVIIEPGLQTSSLACIRDNIKVIMTFGNSNFAFISALNVSTQFGLQVSFENIDLIDL